MMHITSKLYLETIHEALKMVSKEELEHMDEIHLNMQERTLNDLKDWDRDDCMIDGYEYSAFSPYQHLVPPIKEVMKDKIVQCVKCHDYNNKDYMIHDTHYYCKECFIKKEKALK